MRPAGTRPPFIHAPAFRLEQTPTADAPAIPLEHLAHEINSLLDGALRNLRLAGVSITERQMMHAALTDAATRLGHARVSMESIAELLKRVLAPAEHGYSIFLSGKSLEAQIHEATCNLAPLALELQVNVTVELTPKAKSLGSATLGPVIHNGLRNAIQSCGRNATHSRAVEISGFISQRDELVLTISDNGVGVDPKGSHNPDGHGIGLSLSKDIVQALGGEFRLSNIPFSDGAVLQIIIPLEGLKHHG